MTPVPVTLRQQVLVLYLSTSSLASPVVGWSLFDGASTEADEAGDSPRPPYATGLEALRDGWRLFQASQLLPPRAGEEYATSFQKFEFFFEKLCPQGDEALGPLGLAAEAAGSAGSAGR
jgi:hypothetical protein